MNIVDKKEQNQVINDHHNARILIVEDDINLATNLKVELEKRSFSSIDICHSINEAHLFLNENLTNANKRQVVKLVILDIMIPKDTEDLDQCKRIKGEISIKKKAEASATGIDAYKIRNERMGLINDLNNLIVSDGGLQVLMCLKSNQRPDFPRVLFLSALGGEEVLSEGARLAPGSIWLVKPQTADAIAGAAMELLQRP